MNIFFCLNNSYAAQLNTTLLSIMENNSVKIQFYVLSNDLTEENKKRTRELVQSYNNNIEYINVNHEGIDDLKLNIDYISIETYFRYLIPIVKPNLNKCLYLDADLIVNGDITELYEEDLEGFYCAGAKDIHVEHINHKASIGLTKEDLYINAGVLLLNLEKLRENNMTRLFLENTKKYEKIIKFQDQDIINITLKGKLKEINSIYNYTTSNLEYENSKKREAVIIHYTGKDKPWNAFYKCRLAYIWGYYYKKVQEIYFDNIKRYKEISLDSTMLLLSKCRYSCATIAKSNVFFV